MKIKTLLIVARMLAIFILSTQIRNAQAQNFAFELSTPQSGVVVEEVVHPFVLQKYQPPFQIPVVDIQGNAVEVVVAKYINAMRDGNYEQAMGVWDEESQRQIVQDQIKRQTSKDQRVAVWKKLFNSNKVVLTNRIKYASYILIEYQILATDGKLVAEETIVAKKRDVNYVLTLELADSAVVQGWKKPGSRVQRLPRHAYQSLDR
jgi:hypothetical protein